MSIACYFKKSVIGTLAQNMLLLNLWLLGWRNRGPIITDSTINLNLTTEQSASPVLENPLIFVNIANLMATPLTSVLRYMAIPTSPRLLPPLLTLLLPQLTLPLLMMVHLLAFLVNNWLVYCLILGRHIFHLISPMLIVWIKIRPPT